MADDTTVSDDDIQDVSLLDTPDIATAGADATGDAANEGKDNAAAPNEAKPAEGAKPDAKANEATGDKPAGDKPAEGDQKPEEAAKPPVQETREEAQRRAQMEWQNRQRTRNQVAQQLDQHYGPKTEEELIQGGMDARAAEIEALRQEIAYREQRTQVAEMNAGMQAEAVNVINDFPMFNPKSADFDPEFTKMVEQQYKVAARLQVDANGIITNAEVPVYDFYQQMATIYDRGKSNGSQQGQQDALRMLGRTEDAGGSSSTSKGAETLDEMEERLSGVSIV